MSTTAADSENEIDESPDSARNASAKPGNQSVARIPDRATRTMPSMRNVLTITRREIRSYFDSLVAYVVICGSLGAVGLYFFYGGFWQINRVSIGRMFEGLVCLPIALSVLVIPLVTMRAMAEEKRSGTLELLITMPVTDSEVVLGKYFAALSMTTMLLIATLAYPFAMFVWPWHMGPLDWGPVWAGYLGLMLFSGAGVAIGLMFSCITESQVIAFFMTAATLTLLFVIGNLVEYVHGGLGDVISFISFQSRFSGFARGLIDTRAIVYFLSIAILCLLVSFRSLESRKWS
jgi:ABC-2 type transport system permease protein